ncbi:hypothetical protein D0Y65_050404 [Glycine soja]|uniref:Uncharacterized protein n=1 Tax=Glycine soja TaxID=3848 RepID=A0A445FC21_GLYSO|nr:hypothetical protein D0Y65_050404 [Glycine soja]
MLIGHADHISESRSLKDQILGYSGSELSDDEEEDCLEQILYSASFEELASNYVKYDTVIWLAISLLLVLAWGIGLLMLLYLPIRRYVLQKDLSSRRLYVTCTEVVYKALLQSRLSTSVKEVFLHRFTTVVVGGVVKNERFSTTVVEDRLRMLKHSTSVV